MEELANTQRERVDCLADLPARVREIATLRGLGYKHTEIADQLGITPQASSIMLFRFRRALTNLAAHVDLRGLSTRAVNALGRHGITCREDAVRVNSFVFLQHEPNCGAKTLSEIERLLQGDAASTDVESFRHEHKKVVENCTVVVQSV